jgi:hypothetical protein
MLGLIKRKISSNRAKATNLLSEAGDVGWHTQHSITSSQQQYTGASASQVSVNEILVTAVQDKVHCL